MKVFFVSNKWKVSEIHGFFLMGVKKYNNKNRDVPPKAEKIFFYKRTQPRQKPGPMFWSHVKMTQKTCEKYWQIFFFKKYLKVFLWVTSERSVKYMVFFLMGVKKYNNKNRDVPPKAGKFFYKRPMFWSHVKITQKTCEKYWQIFFKKYLKVFLWVTSERLVKYMVYFLMGVKKYDNKNRDVGPMFWSRVKITQKHVKNIDKFF